MIFDQPMSDVLGTVPEALQFQLTQGIQPVDEVLLTNISSTMIQLDYVGLVPDVDEITYTPGVAPLTSRLGAQLEAFNVGIPFP